jgi:DNA excision repair protein ERCC-5
MGVTGLWPILQPCARPTPLPTLNRKRLAVDASIWIYQFLKAVRDKEGNALRNSHVVGFFRRICKLLYFGIKPVFVFDGGAPILKRQTIQGRKQRREGRREDAVRTAGKLLAVQMQRRGEEEAERRKKDREREKAGLRPVDDDEEAIPEGQELVYVGEEAMNVQQRAANRKFKKTDAYHLPELDNGIEGMGQPNDPRIMSAEQLEEYARQFHNGEDVNLYDFSKIDFNGEFFMSLPPVDRYNILNAARLRSRLRMGLSKEQLEDMFPDRMAFSRFQIERVRERNELTQRLMNLNGMNGEDAMFGVGGARIAGERDREYVLVKNDGVEGGWALGVVSLDKSMGERDKPIDVDALHQKAKQNEEPSESEEEFEDVPVEGLNRLPKLKSAQNQNLSYGDFKAQEMADQRRQLYASRNGESSKQARAQSAEPDSLFMDDEAVGGPSARNGHGFDEEEEDLNLAIAMSLQKDQESDGMDEEEHLKRAIALSMQQNHAHDSEADEDMDFEDVPMPEYEQRPVPNCKPLTSSSGGMLAHIVNNRANAAVPKRKAAGISSDSDSDMDLQAALAKARKGKAPAIERRKPAPVVSNTKNPFDGPLPFEKLDFGSSIFAKKAQTQKAVVNDDESAEEDLAGGFENGDEEEASKPLPPWLAGTGDIRSQVKEQQKRDFELNAEDRERALEDERIFRQDNEPIEIESSEGGSDMEIVDAPSEPKITKKNLGDLAEDVRAEPPVSNIPEDRQPSVEEQSTKDKTHRLAAEESEEEPVDWSESEYGDVTTKSAKTVDAEHPAGGRTETSSSKSKSASPEFEDVEMPPPNRTPENPSPVRAGAKSSSPLFEDGNISESGIEASSNFNSTAQARADGPFDGPQRDAEVDEFDFSDPDDEELLAQLAVEAEEHARFASTLNNKSERENQEAYERELKALRNQQKKEIRDADEVSHIMITECQALLRLFGLPYITAPMEAEAQCAELVCLGLVDGVVTDDCDIFLFGGTRVYKNMFNSNKFVECYLSNDIEKELTLSRDQLISIAHLLGSDYTEGLPGVGPVTALEIISEFPTASGIQEFRDWWASTQGNSHAIAISKEPSIFRKKFRRAQGTKLFLPPGFPSPAVTEAYLKPDIDSTPEPFQWGVPDLDRLRDFLMATIGWSQERTDEVLVPVIRDMNRREMEGTQSNITRFFEGAVGVGANTANGKEKNVGSKRMKEAVNKLKAKKQTGMLSQTFGDQAAEWAKKNDLSYTDKEREKAEKGKKGRKKRAAPVVVDDHEVDAEADDEIGSGEEYRNTGKGKSKGKGKAPAKRKRAKV